MISLSLRFALVYDGSQKMLYAGVLQLQISANGWQNSMRGKGSVTLGRVSRAANRCKGPTHV